MTIAIVLFSGGLDSTACLYWAKERYEHVLLMSFLYGSKEDQVIEKINQRFANLLSVDSKIINVPFLGEFSQIAGSALSLSTDNIPEFNEFRELDDEKITQKSATSVWVPGRNILFLSIAASAADSLREPVDIIFGANEEEGATFPDNTPDFVLRMNSAIKLGCLNEVQILAPFSTQIKAEIASFLDRINASYQYSSSCYQIQGWTKKVEPIHCGKCESCLRRKRAFQNNKIDDKTIYVI